jgi:hypothetical protein
MHKKDLWFHHCNGIFYCITWDEVDGQGTFFNVGNYEETKKLAVTK